MNAMTDGKWSILLGLVFVVMASPMVVPAATEELSPMQKEIQELIATDQAELDILNNQFKNAASSEEALGLQVQIQERKISTNVSLFSIQMKYAVERGDEKRVREIEAIIKTLVTDGSQGIPVER